MNKLPKLITKFNKKQIIQPFTRNYSKRTDVWSHIDPIGLDAIKQLTITFQKDTFPGKILLGEGVYRDDNGKPVVQKSVREAEKRLYEQSLDHEYAPVSGVQAFCDAARNFAFGKESKAVKEDRIATVQAISGTGALRIAGEFLKKFTTGNTQVYLPNPTWGNHNNILISSGLTLNQYRYFDKNTNSMDVKGCIEDLLKAPRRSVILFHACAHNPTGVDPKVETWKELSKVCHEREHIVFFDSAYQGFASGNPEKDAESFRIFVEDGHQVLVAQSFSKNVGLYGERVGALNVVCGNSNEAKSVHSQLSVLIRSSFSNPPIYGARIVSTIFNDSQLKSQWEKDVKEMADRISTMRQSLVDALKRHGSTKNWNHITDQIGMFAFSGLTPQQVELLQTKHHIYMTKDGRISISGLNTKNVDHIAKCIHEVTK